MGLEVLLQLTKPGYALGQNWLYVLNLVESDRWSRSGREQPTGNGPGLLIRQEPRILGSFIVASDRRDAI
jgi:hypothetical protein